MCKPILRAKSAIRITLLLWTAIAILSCGGRQTDSAQFDDIVTEALLREGFDQQVEATFARESTQELRAYWLQVPPPSANRPTQFELSVTVKASGAFLSPEKWEERRAAVMALYPNRDSAFIESEFPRVGLRAMKLAGPAGPGGATYGLVFTTQDNKFDIQMTVFQPSSDGAEVPEYHLSRVAQKMANAYQRKNGY